MLKVNNKIIKVNNKWLNVETGPYLPPYTIRLKFKDGVTPSFSMGTGVQVSSSPNIWDLTYNDSDWYELLRDQLDLLEVLGGNTTNITRMSDIFAGCTSLTSVSLFDTSSVTLMAAMFNGCSSLTTVPLFDTSNVTNMSGMFARCTSLTTVLLFDTSKVTDISFMFEQCYNVESGALALYQQASSQAIPPWRHDMAFYDCGINTTTGSAELAQIPSDWK